MSAKTQSFTKIKSTPVLQKTDKLLVDITNTNKKVNHESKDINNIDNIYEERETFCCSTPCCIHFLLENIRSKIASHIDFNLLHLRHYQTPPHSDSSYFSFLELPLDSPEKIEELLDNTAQTPSLFQNSQSYFKMKLRYYLHAFEVSFQLHNGKLKISSVECANDMLFNIFYSRKPNKFQYKLKQELILVEQAYNEICDKINTHNEQLFGVS